MPAANEYVDRGLHVIECRHPMDLTDEQLEKIVPHERRVAYFRDLYRMAAHLAAPASPTHPQPSTRRAASVESGAK